MGSSVRPWPLLVATAAVLLSGGLVLAALEPRVSEEHRGKTAAPFVLEAVGGARVELGALSGRPVLLSFFATWCPPCRDQVRELMALHERLGPRGLAIVGAAADSKILTDTPPEQEQKDVAAFVAAMKVPYPIGIANASMIADYAFEGIPTTIVIEPDGKIGTTFYGYHAAAQIEAAVVGLAPAAAPPAPAGPPPGALEALGGGLLHPFTRGARQLHPALVHFPIAFLLLEAGLLAAYARRKRPELERMSLALLGISVASLPLVILSGVRDSGLELGEGSALLLGLGDRWRNAGNFASTITVHAWLAGLLTLLTSARLAWRWRAGAAALEGHRAIAHAALVLLGLWILVAAASVGGSVRHS